MRGMKTFKILVYFIISTFLTQCHFFKKPALYTLLKPSNTGVTFANTITEDDSLNILNFVYLYNGAGVAAGDINNDGLTDLYFVGNMVSGTLYLNKSQFKFEDITEKAGLKTELWGTGATMIDINQDGWLDIYVCTVKPFSNTGVPNLLFINKGLDKNGSLVFEEKAQAYGLADTGYSTQAAFFDYDSDKDLDMYLLTNAPDQTNRNLPQYKLTQGQNNNTDRLYQNSGNQTFTNVSKAAGIQTEGWGLGVCISDINQDGWPDVYAANDFISNDLLWINNKNGTFTNKIDQYLKHQSYNAMGTDIADYNNDGLVDIMVLDMLPEDNKRQKTTMDAPNYDRFEINKRMGYQYQYVRNSLQLNNGNATFSEVGQLAGVYATDWSWGPLLADFDNDGFRDLFITNGYVRDITDLDYVHYRQTSMQFGDTKVLQEKEKEALNQVKKVKIPNYIYSNKGNLTFANKTDEWGLKEPSNSNGAVYTDLDNDGDLDLVVNNINAEAFVYQNHAENLNKNNFLQIKLNGETPNLGGIGTSIRLKYKGKQQFYEHYLTRGFKSSVDPKVHFGLGKISVIDSLEVTWPDGSYALLRSVKANQILTLRQKDATARRPAALPAPVPFYEEVSGTYNLRFKHEEEDYIDFKNQPLMPHKLSQAGPSLAVGDVNGDGLDDFFVGGSARKTGTIFYQDATGKFTRKPLSTIPNTEDDTGALFFDADNDNDLDLYVATGGNEHLQPEYYLHRLYKNDGQGNFTQDTHALPRIMASGSVVTAADYDQDGDLDLFVGGRNTPKKYPLPGQSCLLRNENGNFLNVTTSLCKELENAGMVTAALWTDFDNDQQIDLIVTGEWMPLLFFKNEQGRFKNVTASTGLQHSEGWWNSITAGDFDNDGDIDYATGNLGQNSRYKASPQQPVTMVAKDFDQNGNIDPVMGYYIQDRNYPAPSRDALTDQMVAMRKKFPRYADYGQITFEALFTPEERKDALELHSYQFNSSYIENLGDGKFSLKPLPVQAQVAPVYGITVTDFNHDGNLDLVLAGNSYATETAIGYYDASIGTCLAGSGKGTFKVLNPKTSGFMVRGDAKAMVQIVDANKSSLLLVSQNNDSLKVFKQTRKTPYEFILFQPKDAYAEVHLRDGRKRKVEAYYGAGYLSQSCRGLWAPPNATIYITDFQGKRRQITSQNKTLVSISNY